MLLEHLISDSPADFIKENWYCYSLVFVKRVNSLFLRFVFIYPIGSVDVSVDSLDMGVEVEKWYPVTMESNKTNGGESSSIRLRFKYQVNLTHWSPYLSPSRLQVVSFTLGLTSFLFS